MTLTTPTTQPTSASERPATVQGPASRVRHGLERLASWRIWLVSAALFVPFAFVFFAGSAPFSIPEVEAACGQVPLDMRFFTGGDGVVEFLDACGPDGRRSYTNMQLADLIYPTLVGALLASSLALTIRRLFGSPSVMSWLVALPLLATVFDYAENAFAWLAIAAYPDPTITNEVLGFASAAKTTTSWAGGLALLGCLAALGWRRGRDHLANR